MLRQPQRPAPACLADGNANFSRPGPRLSDSAEILAGTLHPDAAGRHQGTARLPVRACRTVAGVAAMALLCFAAPASAATSAPYAYGGSAKVFEQHVARFRQSGEPFRITGHCQSACTMFLALPNVCIEPGAELLFHAGGHEFATRLLINSYNTPLRRYLRAQHAMETRAFHAISGRDMISRFGYRACR
jgi:hypothetical protein